MNHAERLAKENALASYFGVQKQYYEFLRMALGEAGFRGDSSKANGQIRISGEWQHLASVEGRLKLREIALECMAGKKVFAVGRMGTRRITGMVDFPYLVESPVGDYEYSWVLWNFNEITTIWTFDAPITDEEIIAHITELSKQNMMDAALKAMPCTVEFDSEW